LKPRKSRFDRLTVKVGDDPDAKEDGIGNALPTGHPIQSQAAFQFLEEVLRLTSLVVPLQDLEGAFLFQGPIAGHGHAWRVVEVSIFCKQIHLAP